MGVWAAVLGVSLALPANRNLLLSDADAVEQLLQEIVGALGNFTEDIMGNDVRDAYGANFTTIVNALATQFPTTFDAPPENVGFDLNPLTWLQAAMLDLTVTPSELGFEKDHDETINDVLQALRSSKSARTLTAAQRRAYYSILLKLEAASEGDEITGLVSSIEREDESKAFREMFNELTNLDGPIYITVGDRVNLFCEELKMCLLMNLGNGECEEFCNTITCDYDYGDCRTGWNMGGFAVVMGIAAGVYIFLIALAVVVPIICLAGVIFVLIKHQQDQKKRRIAAQQVQTGGHIIQGSVATATATTPVVATATPVVATVIATPTYERNQVLSQPVNADPTLK